MPASRSWFAALDADRARRAATATVRQIREAPEWSWRSTGDPGIFEIWRHGASVGVMSLLPGHVERRSVLMDTITEHLNNESLETAPPPAAGH